MYKALKPRNLTEEQIATLKDAYGKLYRVEIAGEIFTFRPLFKPDWDKITEMLEGNESMTQAELDERIANEGLIDPIVDVSVGGWSALPAGIPSTLASNIRLKSGFIVAELANLDNSVVEPLSAIEDVNKPSEVDLDALKKGSPHRLKLFVFEGRHYVLRPITRIEWKAIIKETGDGGDIAEELAKKVTIWPKKIDWDKELAGIPEAIRTIVLDMSGYTQNLKVTEV